MNYMMISCLLLYISTTELFSQEIILPSINEKEFGIDSILISSTKGSLYDQLSVVINYKTDKRINSISYKINTENKEQLFVQVCNDYKKFIYSGKSILKDNEVLLVVGNKYVLIEVDKNPDRITNVNKSTEVDKPWQLTGKGHRLFFLCEDYVKEYEDTNNEKIPISVYALSEKTKIKKDKE